MRITIIGTGNVSSHITPALQRAGHKIVGVTGRDNEKTETFAKTHKTKAFATPQELPESDMVILAVTDDSIVKVASQLTVRKETIVVHTSGATPMSSLGRASSHIGVLYPCQTFTTGDKIEMAKTPFMIEGSDQETESVLMKLAGEISDITPVRGTSEQRKALHVAAVFASNFTNHMIYRAERILAGNGMKLGIMEQLVEQTMKKAFRMGPYAAQTGPARRNDMETIKRHQELISDDKEAKAIYDIMTESIKTTYANRDE